MNSGFLKFMAKLDLSEEAEQRVVWQHWKIRGLDGALGWATPNGGKRGKREAANFKATGVVPGIPDLFFLKAGQLYGIEMKKRQGGALGKNQKIIIPELNRAGAIVVVARGADEALDYLEQWGLLKGERWGVRVEGIPGFTGHDRKIMEALAV